MRPLKPTAERVREAVAIRAKLDSLGLSPEDDDFKRLCDVLSDFVRSGTGFSGRLPLRAYGRVALVRLSVREGAKTTVTLRAAGAAEG
jgi:hypothetical protein